MKTHLKILLKTSIININLQTLTAKNRLDESAGFLGIRVLLYIESQVAYFF